MIVTVAVVPSMQCRRPRIKQTMTKVIVAASIGYEAGDVSMSFFSSFCVRRLI